MSIKDKYNKTGKLPKSKGNRDVVNKIITKNQDETNTDNNIPVNTEIQEPVKIEKEEVKKTIKKATFELDSELHKRLRMFAVEQDSTMVEVVEKALIEYIGKFN